MRMKTSLVPEAPGYTDRLDSIQNVAKCAAYHIRSMGFDEREATLNVIAMCPDAGWAKTLDEAMFVVESVCATNSVVAWFRNERDRREEREYVASMTEAERLGAAEKRRVARRSEQLLRFMSPGAIEREMLRRGLPFNETVRELVRESDAKIEAAMKHNLCGL